MNEGGGIKLTSQKKKYPQKAQLIRVKKQQKIAIIKLCFLSIISFINKEMGFYGFRFGSYFGKCDYDRTGK